MFLIFNQSFFLFLRVNFLHYRGTLYRPEKPPMFDDDNKFNSKEDLNFPRRNTTAPQQSRPVLPVPIVYH